MTTTPNLRIVYTAATPDPVRPLDHFEIVAMLRARTLRRACFNSQLACANFYRIGLTSVRCYESGERGVPGWYLMALEARCRELNVKVAEQPRKAA